MCIIFAVHSISPSLPAKSAVRGMRALYFSYYDIPRDTNPEIEKSPVGEITPTRYVPNGKRDAAARSRKNELFYFGIIGVVSTAMRARVISAVRN